MSGRWTAVGVAMVATWLAMSPAGARTWEIGTPAASVTVLDLDEVRIGTITPRTMPGRIVARGHGPKGYFELSGNAWVEAGDGDTITLVRLGAMVGGRRDRVDPREVYDYVGVGGSLVYAHVRDGDTDITIAAHMGRSRPIAGGAATLRIEAQFAHWVDAGLTDLGAAAIVSLRL